MAKVILILPRVVTLHQIPCVILDYYYGNSLLLPQYNMVLQ
jgi:hypothetical protein